MRNYRVYWTILGAGLLVGAPGLSAARKSTATPPVPGRIDVIAHFPLAGGPVTELTIGTHWQRKYLYADHGGAGPVDILDVTNPAAPAAAGVLHVPAQEAGGSLSAVVGTAALITSSPPASTERAAQTVTVTSFADPERPAVARQFPGITSMARDDSRGLIYLAGSDGLWVILAPGADRQQTAQHSHFALRGVQLLSQPADEQSQANEQAEPD
jgi:hypothetical protein